MIKIVVIIIPTEVGMSKPKLPKPKSFGGIRSFKELKKSMWNVDQYFSVAKIRARE